MAPDVEICNICEDNFIVNTKAVNCGICKVKCHPSCVSIKDSWLKNLMECENILWLCNHCKRSLHQQKSSSTLEVTIFQKEIECLNRELELTKRLLEELEYTNNLQKSIMKSQNISIGSDISSQPGPRSFSEVVKKNPPLKTSSVLLVKTDTRNQSDVQGVLRDVTTTVKPASLNVCINSTRTIKNGIAVHCKDEESRNKLKETLQNKFGEKYSITESKNLNPRLLIKNVNLDGLESPDDILDNIVSLNSFLNTKKPYIKFVTELKYRNSTNIVIEVTPALRKVLLQEGSLFIGWKKSSVQDHLRVLKCFKCCSYGHTEKVCKSDLICPKCTRNHKLKECDSEVPQCINCLNYNKSNKKKLPTDHSSYFNGCPLYQSYIENLKSRINYE